MAQPRKRRADDFLRPTDAEGRVFDFHALRHQYISSVVNSGASVKVCQELARHSTPMLTLGRYAHVRLADLRKALPAVPTGDMPEPQAMPLRMTGTDNAAPNNAPLMHQTGRDSQRSDATCCDKAGRLRIAGDDRNPLENAGVSKAQRHNARHCEIGSARIRTENQGIMSPLL